MRRDGGIGLITALISVLVAFAVLSVSRLAHSHEEEHAFEGRWVVMQERPLDDERMEAIDRATHELAWPLDSLVRRILAAETRPPASFTLRSATAGLELVVETRPSIRRGRAPRPTPNRTFARSGGGRVEAAWTLPEAEGRTTFELDEDGSLWIIEWVRITSPEVPPITYRYHGRRAESVAVRRDVPTTGPRPTDS